MPKWKWIPNYKGYYQITKKGKIRSVNRYVKHSKKFYRLRKGKIKKTSIVNGYPFVVLSKNGLNKGFAVHRLVALVFIGICPDGQEVMHLYKGKSPKLRGLRYGSHQCNMAFKIDDKTNPSGSNNGRSKLTEKEVLKIRKLYLKGKTIKKISKKIKISTVHAFNIINRKYWVHI